MMQIKKCLTCGKTCWHNSLGKKAAEAQGWRCTFCGYPLGTGPKKDKMESIHQHQLRKAGR